MKKRILGIIGGSGLYKIEGLENIKWKKVNTSWGEPSDRILSATLNKKEVYFIPRHKRGHRISPTNINFRANIEALKKNGDNYGILVENNLLEQLNLVVGSNLKLGKSLYNIRGTMSSIPDIGSNGFSLGSKVILNTN